MTHHHPSFLASPKVILIGAWAILAGLYVLRSPDGAFTHDFRGHMQHTQILYQEHRLALPREGWETFQPPLYYGVSALFSPGARSHVFQIRLVSMAYGMIALALMAHALVRLKVSPEIQIIVLSFIATTPAFLFIFTTYNNDSLATLLSIGLLISAHAWIKDKKRESLVLFGLSSTLGLYTKLSVAYPLTAVMLIVAGLVGTRRQTLKNVFPLVGTAAVSLLLLTPWLIGHNVRLTGRLTPAPADTYQSDLFKIPSSPLKTVITPPGWTRGEWTDPYAHAWDIANNKKGSFLAYVFDTSVFGEYTFDFMPALIPWAMLLIHGILWMAACYRARKAPYGLLLLSLIFLGFLFQSHMLFRAPFGGFMDFRYVAWIWLPGAVLVATGLAPFAFFRGLLMSGTVLHGLLWLALVAGGQWNRP